MLPFMETLGSRIKYYRKQKLNSEGKPWTQSDLSNVTNIVEHYISEIETGKAKNLKLDTLYKIADALDVKITMLLEEGGSEVHIINQDYYDMVEFLQNNGIESLAVLQHKMALDDTEQDCLMYCREAKTKGLIRRIEQIIEYELARAPAPPKKVNS
jgi:transcriptional regulator with XRE-family HTH domain